MTFDLSTLLHKDEDNNSNGITVTHDNIESEVLLKSRETPVVLLIGSDRSEASKKLRADLNNLAGQAKGSWIFAYVDADTTIDIAQMLGVNAIPTVIALYQARPVTSFQGGQKLEDLQQWTAALVAKTTGGVAGDQAPEEVEDPRFTPALEALNNGDYDAAIAVYDSILAQEPKNTQAQAARLNALYLRRMSSYGGSDPIRELETNPTDLDTILAAADYLIAQGQVDQAFDLLISNIKKEEAKERLLELFGLFEASDPRVLVARQKMASALF